MKNGFPITNFAKIEPQKEQTSEEKNFKGIIVNHMGKKFEFSHILDGVAYYIRVEWKKGSKHYLNQFVQKKINNNNSIE